MKTDRTVLALAVIGSLVMLNIIGLKVFGRLDLTGDGQYTLSKATKDTLRILKDPVTVKAYFSKDMPAQYAANARYVQDLLEEYYAAGGGAFRYEFIDPLEAETDADKEKKKEVKQDIFGRAVRDATSIEQELERLGIPPLQVQAREDDKVVVKRAYMGLAVKYGDNTEVIPVVKDTGSLEYDLTLLVRKLTREKNPKIAFVIGDDSTEPQKDFGKLYGLLSQNYDVATVNLSSESSIADDVDAIIVIGPKTPYSDAAKRAIDAFVMTGRSAAFLVDVIKPELSTLQAQDADHGLGEMLRTYGVEILPGLALDGECAAIQVQKQQGFMRIMQPVQYPFMPIAKSTDADHPLTRGMGQMAFPFMSPLQIAATQGSGVTAQVLVKTSAQGWIQPAPFNLDPFQRWTRDSIGEQKELDLLITLEGAIRSAYAAPAGITDEAGPGQAADGRVLVAGGSAFLTDQFVSQQTAALVLNLVDWLLLDQAFLAVRSRGLAAAPVDPDLSEVTRNVVKFGNIVGLPLAFAVFGLVRWRRREARRGRVSL